jgi:DNA-binding NarL/FixJ family response regulator
MKTQVCIFDDSKAILQSLKALFDETSIEVVGAFTHAENCIKQVEKLNPDVVLMDIDMGASSGIEAVKQIRKQYLQLPILMFTVFEDDENVFNAICAGANGYILKSTPPELIIQFIEDVKNGGAPMSPGIARKIIERFQQINKAVPSEDYQLTPRERDILKHLTKGLSYKMVASECGITFETVRTHIKNIYSKLHVASMTEAVAKAINEKLV